MKYCGWWIAINLCHHIGSVYHSNIKVLDLSHNVITGISAGFFRPAEISLTHLYLAHNQLTVSKLYSYAHVYVYALFLSANVFTFSPRHSSFTHSFTWFEWHSFGIKLFGLVCFFSLLQNTTRDIFGHMPHLHWLDLSYNLLSELDFDSFFSSKKLQVCVLYRNVFIVIKMKMNKLINNHVS